MPADGTTGGVGVAGQPVAGFVGEVERNSVGLVEITRYKKEKCLSDAASWGDGGECWLCGAWKERDPPVPNQKSLIVGTP